MTVTKEGRAVKQPVEKNLALPFRVLQKEKTFADEMYQKYLA